MDLKNKNILQDLYSDLVVDFESEGSVFRDYFEALIVNTIFQELKKDQRVSFIKWLDIGNKADISNFLNNNIPNLKKLISGKLEIEINIMKKIGGFNV